jgi:PAS domain S-box-containing protein
MTERPILVVEDNATTRKMLRIALEVEGYTVCEAEDGRSALRLASERPPALVLMDCRLPDLDGFEVARQLHESMPELPLIAVTGWTQLDESRVLSSGFVNVLLKPVEPSRLIEVVCSYVDRNLPRGERRDKLVLLIDDDSVQLKLASLAFGHAGFDVQQASDGLEGLARAREARPDLIVSDVLMPGLDGFQLCHAIRSDPQLQRTPVVLTSAHYLENEDQALATKFGANAYVSRSVGFEQVVSAALLALESNTPRAAAPAPESLQSDYLRRIARQLERQAALNTGLAQRASLQATALSVLEGISNSLAGQVDPEGALEDTLTQCLDAAGLSVGAIMILDAHGKLTLRAHVGTADIADFERHLGVFGQALQCDSLIIPSADSGPDQLALVETLGVKSAILVPILARHEVLGALLLASNRPDFAGSDGTSFVRAARSVSMQLGQALAVGRIFSRLASAEQRYRALLDNASDAIAILSPEGRMLEVNRGWESLFGASRQHLIGRELSELFPDGQARPADFFDAVERGQGPLPPMPVRRSDGAELHVEFSSTAIEIGGERLVLLIGRDVGERLKLAEQLRQAQKMEAVGRLAGGVAHDMNNVLAAVLAYAQFLREALPVSDPRRDDAEEILKAAQRGAALTRQLLAFSRQKTHQPRILDLNEVVNHLLKMLRTIIGEDIEIEARLTPGLPRIKVDASHIEQVIMNLAVNSRDAMPKGGRLRIGTEVRGERVLITVTDTGAGMTAEVLQHAFEPFYTTKEQGTGLGLSTVFGIVKQSGGEIEIASTPGQGTTISVFLPQAAGAEEAAPAPPHQPNSAGSETLLLIEDDDALRMALVRTLERHGYSVFSCKTGAEAIALAASGKSALQLIVTDVVLPQMSGPEAAAEIRRYAPEAKLLFISGYTDTTAHRDVPVNGPAFLQKPFSPDAFAARVRSVLDGFDG